MGDPEPLLLDASPGVHCSEAASVINLIHHYSGPSLDNLPHEKLVAMVTRPFVFTPFHHRSTSLCLCPDASSEQAVWDLRAPPLWTAFLPLVSLSFHSLLQLWGQLSNSRWTFYTCVLQILNQSGKDNVELGLVWLVLSNSTTTLLAGHGIDLVNQQKLHFMATEIYDFVRQGPSPLKPNT